MSTREKTEDDGGLASPIGHDEVQRRMSTPRARWALLSLVAGGMMMLASGCDSLLEVEDPQRFTSSDLDQAPEAVARGAVGKFEQGLDTYVISTALASDEYAHTGTWDSYDDYDHGRFRYGDAAFSDVMDNLLEARWFAGAAQSRFDSILDDPSSSPEMARVRVVEGLTDLYIGESWCEAPAEAGGPAVSRAEILQQSISRLEAASQTAQAAGLNEWVAATVAARARAHNLLGDHDRAASLASQVSTDFEFVAEFSAASGNQENSVVQLTTASQNRAAGMRQKWWPMVDTAQDMLREPWQNELDPRVPVLRTPGVNGVDGRTPHFSQWKYRTLGANIPILDGEEMRLIEAEAAWRADDYQAAIDLINDLRVRAGLSEISNPGTAEGVMQRLLYARFAENLLEGRRLATLHRFGVVQEMLGAGHFGDETRDPRPTLFPISQAEVVANSNMEDDVQARCLPMSGGG